jgi:hypothetical protein
MLYASAPEPDHHKRTDCTDCVNRMNALQAYTKVGTTAAKSLASVWVLGGEAAYASAYALCQYAANEYISTEALAEAFAEATAFGGANAKATAEAFARVLVEGGPPAEAAAKAMAQALIYVNTTVYAEAVAYAIVEVPHSNFYGFLNFF